jgi:SAD/SRA domain
VQALALSSEYSKLMVISIYTGTGGNTTDQYGQVIPFLLRSLGSFAQVSSQKSNQTDDQSFMHHDNAALKKNAQTKQPVRVVRGVNARSKYAPDFGFRYDGLYMVEKVRLEFSLAS